MKKFNFSFLNNIQWMNHFMGFFSVVLGVLLAFWLNDWNTDKKEQEQINIALVNLKSEMKVNMENSQIALDANSKQHDYMNAIASIVDDDFELTVENEILDSIYLAHWNKPKPESNVRLADLELFGLSEVAYKTFLETRLINSIEFELAINIQETYMLQNKISKLDDDIIDEVKDLGNDKSKLMRLKSTVRISNQLVQSLLNEYYPKSIEMIDNYLNKHGFND